MIQRTTISSIDYAPRRGGRLRRRLAWPVGTLVVLISITLIGRRWAPRLWKNAQDVWVFDRCAAYTAPPDQVVYEEDPAAATRLTSALPGYTSLDAGYYPLGATVQIRIGAGLVPRCWSQEFARCDGMFGSSLMMRPEATLFLHERRTAGGQIRLVAVDYADETVDGGIRCYFALVARPSLITGGQLIESNEKHHYPSEKFWKSRGLPEDWVSSRSPLFSRDLYKKLPFLRFYAGQPDPADASHFTIRYALHDQYGMIDGWLIDNPRATTDPESCYLRLDVRDGPALPVQP